MALVSSWLLLLILVCNVGTLFLNCAVSAQPQILGVKFDEPDTKMVSLDKPASLACYIYGEMNYITSVRNRIQIVKRKGGAESVLYETGQVASSRYTVAQNWSTYPRTKLHILLRILSVQTNDDAEFICKFVGLDGRVYDASVKLQVFAMPGQIVCGKRTYRTYRRSIQVTCTMVVYPQGSCKVVLINLKAGGIVGQHGMGLKARFQNLSSSGVGLAFHTFSQKNVASKDSDDSQSSALSYHHFWHAKGFYTTTCIVDGPLSKSFHIALYPSLPDPRNVTVYSDIITEDPSLAFISSFEANDKSADAIKVDEKDKLKLECKARGPTPTRIYLFRVKPHSFHRKLLYSLNSKEIEFEIDDVTREDDGVYYCQAGYDMSTSRQITVVISSRGSTDSSQNPEYKDLSRNLIIICSTVALGGLALIVSVITCALCCIKRRRARQARAATSTGIVLSVPTAPDYQHIYSYGRKLETSFQMSPPPYSTICDKEGIHDLAPPPYPGVTDTINTQPVEQLGQELPTTPSYSR